MVTVIDNFVYHKTWIRRDFDEIWGIKNLKWAFFNGKIPVEMYPSNKHQQFENPNRFDLTEWLQLTCRMFLFIMCTIEIRNSLLVTWILITCWKHPFFHSFSLHRTGFINISFYTPWKHSIPHPFYQHYKLLIIKLLELDQHFQHLYCYYNIFNKYYL